MSEWEFHDVNLFLRQPLAPFSDLLALVLIVVTVVSLFDKKVQLTTPTKTLFIA
jgi:hypothetical protein